MFKQLKRGNDWGYEYFAVEPLTKEGFTDRKNEIIFKNYDQIEIKWPNKRITTEKIVIKNFINTVSDHGKEYKINFELAGIEVNFNGIKSWIPLDSKGLKVNI